MEDEERRLTSSFFILFSYRSMTRDTSQGAGARQGAPKSPPPAPSSASALDDRIAVLEEALTDVRESMGILR